MKLSRTILASFFLFAFCISCGSEAEESTETEETISSPEDLQDELVNEILEENDGWIAYIDMEAGYSIEFPGAYESRVDTTNSYYVHLAAFQTDSRYYRVTSYVTIEPFEVEGGRDYIDAMKESMNSNYTIEEEIDKTYGDYEGLLVKCLRDGWAFYRFMTFQNEFIHILDIASIGEEQPSDFEVEEFYGKFETINIQ